MHRFLISTFVLAGSLFASPAYASDEGLEGLVVNQSISRFGQDFYNQFVKHWADFQLLTPVALSIHERPSANRGSLIWIEMQGRRLFQRNVGPNARAIESMAKEAASRVFMIVLQEKGDVYGNDQAIDDGIIY